MTIDLGPRSPRIFVFSFANDHHNFFIVVVFLVESVSHLYQLFLLAGVKKVSSIITHEPIRYVTRERLSSIEFQLRVT